MSTTYRSPLHETVSTTATDLWNDSCSVQELSHAIEHGATGATTNPTIVLSVLNKEMHLWRDRIHEIIAGEPTWSEVQVTWRLIEEMAVRGAGLLHPVFERERGLKGRLSIQTNPQLYRDAGAMVEQAVLFDHLAPNMQVKIPATRAGLDAIEEATFRGVSINATVCFTIPQAVAVAEAVERGLERRKAAGAQVSGMSPVCTIMVGRLDDWMKVLAGLHGIIVDPGTLDWAGVACFKKAYGIFVERGYRARLLAAAFRHHLHWSQLIGADVVLTIPHGWQLKLNGSGVEVRPRIDEPVAPVIVETLMRKFPDFRKAYEVDGMSVDEFDDYGATGRTLRGFISSYHDLVAVVRDFMLPDPDVG